MEKWEETMAILEDILSSKQRRHITGGILISMALFFGGIAVTVITIKNISDESEEESDYESKYFK